MQTISFPTAHDNEVAHRQLKLLMKQGKQLNIRVEDEAWVSSQGVTGLRYQLNENSWQWILTYRQATMRTSACSHPRFQGSLLRASKKARLKNW